MKAYATNCMDDINFKNEITKFEFITFVETWLGRKIQELSVRRVE